MNKQKKIFIVGSSRSGTTMMSRVLNNNKSMSLQPSCIQQKDSLSKYINGYCVFNNKWAETLDIIMIVLFLSSICTMIVLIRQALFKVKEMKTYNPGILHV